MSQFTLHIFLSSVENETRLFKEAAYTLRTGICRRVLVLGLWREGLLTSETTDYGLEIQRLPTMVRRFNNLIRLPWLKLLRKLFALISILEYTVSCLVIAKRMRPDHISCHNAAMLPVAWAAARISDSTLEYLPHELESQRTGLGAIAAKFTMYIERTFIYGARNVVVVSDPIRTWYEEVYKLSNIHVVRNVPELESVAVRPVPGGGFRERFGIPCNAKIFIYQGLISAGRGIEALIEAFSKIDPSRCHLVLMGYCEESYQMIIDKAAMQQSNIHYLAAVGREWIVSYSATADVGIFVTERASLSYRYALPNKFFEWAHAGLPILVSDNLEYQADLLRQGGFGWATPLENLDAAVLRLSETELAAFSENARRYAVSAVWEKDAKIFAAVYRAGTT